MVAQFRQSATDGKSLGNLRAMHSNVAAGKLVEIAFNDEQRRIEICGKVVDDAEWAEGRAGRLYRLLAGRPLSQALAGSRTSRR